MARRARVLLPTRRAYLLDHEGRSGWLAPLQRPGHNGASWTHHVKARTRHMPAPLMRCLGCGRKTPHSRCATCRRKGDAQYDTHHRNLRLQVLARDGHACQCRGCTSCLATNRGCTRVATTADHMIPLAQGGATEIDNLQAMCRPCNSSKRDR